MKLEVSYTWIDPGPGMRGTSDRETFADLRLEVGSRALTWNRSIRRGARGSAESVHVSLFPLAEFVAFNWWALLYEPRKTPSIIRLIATAIE